MKKSELKQLIREIVEETFAPKKGKYRIVVSDKWPEGMAALPPPNMSLTIDQAVQWIETQAPGIKLAYNIISDIK